MSPAYFQRLFRATVGMRVLAYVRRRRLSRSVGELLETDRRILEIAIEAGEVPLRAVVGSADTMAPPPENARRLARLAPGATLWELDGVDHSTFLGACGWGGRLLLGDICREAPAGSRAAVLPEVASDGLRFFESAAAGP